MSNAIELPPLQGRIVQGHPIRRKVKLDDAGQPKLKLDGSPVEETYFALAIAKGAEQGWWETPWGSLVFSTMQTLWPNGETQRPTFSWKIEDGDSTTPNQTGKINAEREGFAGHWIVKFSTRWEVACYHHDRLAPTQRIMEESATKTGDYVTVIAKIKSNETQRNPGLYMTPAMVRIDAAGNPIVSENAPDAAAAFANVAVNLPANAQLAPAVAPAAPAAQPAAMPGAAPAAPAAQPAAMPGAAPAAPAAPAAQPAAMPGAAPAAPAAQPAAMPGAAPAAQPAGIQPAHNFLNGPQ